jgi:hypothetical protein
MDNYWSRWESFCMAHNIDPYLRTWADPVPILQVFGERYRDRRLAPLKKPAKYRTVEDALRAVGQAHARLGALDPRKDGHGGIDFRIQRQLRAYKKDDAPSKCVKPIPIMIIIYILAQANGNQRQDPELAIADMITSAFFFLLRPGEFTGTTSDDTPFRLQYVGLYIGPRRLDFTRASDAELYSATSVSYTFTTQRMMSRMKRSIWQWLVLPRQGIDSTSPLSSFAQVQARHAHCIVLLRWPTDCHHSPQCHGCPAPCHED